MENTNNIQKTDFGKIFAQWKFSEMPRYQRGPLWYFLIGMLMVLLLGYAIFTRNFLFALIIILFSLIYFILDKNAKVLNFTIAEDGITVGNKYYAYKEIEKFWIIYEPPEIKSLYFHIKRSFSPILLIPLEDQNPVEVRKILLRYIKEDLSQKEEPPFDSFYRLFKL